MASVRIGVKVRDDVVRMGAKVKRQALRARLQGHTWKVRSHWPL